MSSSQQPTVPTISKDDPMDDLLKDLEASMYEYASKINSSLADEYPELSTERRGKLVAAATGSVISSVNPSSTNTRSSEKK